MRSNKHYTSILIFEVNINYQYYNPQNHVMIPGSTVKGSAALNPYLVNTLFVRQNFTPD